jgi:hypothetical protein
MATMSASKRVSTGQSKEHVLVIMGNELLPRPRRTCVMAPRVASSPGFKAKTSSHKTSDSSTFCNRMRARAFNACGHKVHYGDTRESKEADELLSEHW